MFLLIASFLAGVLTSIAPCVLPLLPVIVGSSVVPGSDKKQDRKKPYVIAASLGISVILFTLLLKASTVLIGIDPDVWLYLSGGIVVLLGVSMLVPKLWTDVSLKLGFEDSSNKLLARANKSSGLGSQIMTGVALGPVFSSCSPVYALVLATVLPVNLALGMVYMVAYALGLGLALLAISLAGRRLTAKLGWAANPNGWFRRVLAVVLIIVGIGVIFGFDKKIQTWTIENVPFDIRSIEERLLPEDDDDETNQSSNTSGDSVFNINAPYEAPELQDIANWINSDGETLKDLEGSVVLIDFWTYSCINCIRTQPFLNAWHETYNQDGLVIIGVHAPEFAFEKTLKNVDEAVMDADIAYPVALDNDFATWKAYENKFWPAKYLIDKDGQVRYTHFGEGDYEETEEAIQLLLAETGTDVTAKSITLANTKPKLSSNQTPETYLGYARGERFADSESFIADESVNYPVGTELGANQWSLSGSWSIGETQSVSTGDDAKLRIRFTGKDVFLVMSGNGGQGSVMLDGEPVSAEHAGEDVKGGAITPTTPRLYTLITSEKLLEGSLLELNLPKDTIINAFTFGS